MRAGRDALLISRPSVRTSASSHPTLNNRHPMRDHNLLNVILTDDEVLTGTGLAGFTHAEMAPLFRGCHSSNCVLPEEWKEFLK